MRCKKREYKTGGAGITPPGSRKQNMDRRFDQTQLRERYHGRMVHRDYAAHFFRWGFVANFLKKSKDQMVLDVGCGQDIPLIKVIQGNINILPKGYVGVDLNKLPDCGNRWVEALYDETNYLAKAKEIREVHGKFDVITCFEVIEHMHTEDGHRLLREFRRSLTGEGMLFLSTPVYNEKKMAANHLHEWTIPELTKAIGDAGLEIVDRFGTFASWPEIRKHLTPMELDLVYELNKYYSHDVLSCFLAPKYPNFSRNNTWVVRGA